MEMLKLLKSRGQSASKNTPTHQWNRAQTYSGSDVAMSGTIVEDTAFPSLSGGADPTKRGADLSWGGGSRTGPTARTQTWDIIPSETERYGDRNNYGPISMNSHYFYIGNAGTISKLKKALVDAKLGGDNCMVRT